MEPKSSPTGWQRWCFRTKQVTVTTWKLRFLALLLPFAALYLTYPAWLVAVGASLIHDDKPLSADVLLLENYDTDYLVFESAEALLRAGYSTRVLVPVLAEDQTMEPGSVHKAFAEVMGRVAGIGSFEIIPVLHTEPVTLSVAVQVAKYLENNGIRSVLVVSPRFRSTRSHLVYNHVLGPRGIRVQIVSARAPISVDDWWHSWHGVQDIWLEFSKLLYYRFWVL